MNFKKIWHFIWKEDSLASWAVNIILAFILVKFVIYPGLGFLLKTSYPVVAVVSGSMEHNGLSFDKWWESRESEYKGYGIKKEDFEKFPLKGGFNKGDIIILYGIKTENARIGDVIVYANERYKYPIIHRVVEKNGYFKTRGDHNPVDDGNIDYSKYLGKAYIRIPYLGWVKILATQVFSLLRF